MAKLHSLGLLVFSAFFVLAGCEHLAEVYTPSSYTLDNLKIDNYFARTELLQGYKNYAGKVVKIMPFNGGNWADYSKVIYWDWGVFEPGQYHITVSMSVMAEKPGAGKASVSAYRPSERISKDPSNIKWNGPANIGWTITNEDDVYAQFGGKVVAAQEGKWVDLAFSEAFELKTPGTYQIFLDGHNDQRGLLDLNLYIRHAKITITGTSNYVALTFDDSPSDFTQYLLDKLENLNVKATFFILEEGMDARHPVYDKNLDDEGRPEVSEARKETVKKVFDSGHEIANFSDFYGFLSENEIRREIEANRIAIQKAVYGGAAYSRLPWVSKFIRIPNTSDMGKAANLKKVAAAMGLPIIGGISSENDDPLKTANNLINAVKPWGIIVCKDLRSDPAVMEVLDGLIPGLKAKGYMFMTLSEMNERRNKALIPGNLYDNLDPASP